MKQHYAMKEIDRDHFPLHDYVSDMGDGLASCYRISDEEGVQFIREQFARFGLDCPPRDFLSGIFTEIFRIFDCFEPYLWFEFTDVTTTTEWQYNTFDVMGTDGKIKEAMPEHFDHFRLIKGREQAVFDDMMSNPSIKHPNILYIDHHIEDMFDGDNYPYEESVICRYGDEVRDWLESKRQPRMEVPRFNKELFAYTRVDEDGDKTNGYLCIADMNEILKGNTIDKKTKKNILSPEIRPIVEALVHNWKQEELMFDYARLAIWASFTWLVSPMAHEFRRSLYDIFDAVYADGECIFYDGNVYPKKNYNIIARSPASCTECGINGWCISQVHVLGVNRHQCEFHVNGDLPKIFPVNCGTLFCKATECIHHPYRGMKDAKLIVHREGGAITQKLQASRTLSLGYRPPTAGFLN